MPKNKGKGGKSKRKGKNSGHEGSKRQLIMKVEGQEYAQVTKILGNCRVSAYCFDGVERLCHVRGKFRRRVWINRDDIVLVGLRDYQDDKADIIHRYSPEEARTLKMLKELPAKARIDIDTVDAPSDDEIIDPRDNVDPNDYLGLGDLSESEDDEDDDEDEEDEEEDFYDDDSHDSELDAL
mmetsp:Transcript_18283/g.31113  ORF Transcript_18283/g.31113 Transcript_18283/m.31113 type:complete len:181 (+) Transcript_18283:73-615(+)